MSRRLDPWTIVLGLFALGNLLNGLWMLASPAHWYIHLPANVPGSGPLNEHFVRDIGCIFLLIGLALAWAAVRPSFRVTAMLFATGFYVTHACVHVLDSMRGLFPPGQWRYDLVPVYGTALLLIVLTVTLARGTRGALGMKRVEILAALVVGTWLFFVPFIRFAVGVEHPNHMNHEGRHGGRLLMVRDYHVELVEGDEHLEVYLSDAQRRPVRARGGHLQVDHAPFSALTWQSYRLRGKRPPTNARVDYMLLPPSGPELHFKFP